MPYAATDDGVRIEMMHLRMRGAMRTRRLILTWPAWLAAVVTLVGASTVGAVTPVPARFREVRDFMVWRGERIESHGLELTARSEFDEVMAFRLFVRPQGRPSVIFSSCMDAVKGVLRTRLTDDQTGWWIEVREEPGVTGRHVMELFSRITEARLSRYRGYVQTSEGDAIEFDVPQSKGGSKEDPWSPLPKMARVVVEKGREKGRLASLPAGVSQSADFLDSITEDPGSSQEAHDSATRSMGYLRSVVAVVLQMRGHMGPRREAVVASITAKGTDFSALAVREFLAGFRSVSPEHPMGDVELIRGSCASPRQ
jgi:hypothetical protein